MVSRLLAAGLLAVAATPLSAQSPDGRAFWRSMSAPRLECRAATQYLTWQWSRYAAPGDVPAGSPLNAMARATEPAVLATLSSGVSHNPQAVGVYQSCAAATSPEYLVWMAATATDRQCDMAAANVNLSWQKQNVLPSLNEAMRHWNMGRAAKTVADENAHALAAAQEMFAAVRHNATAGAVYRACFRDRPEDFFQAVRLLLGG